MRLGQLPSWSTKGVTVTDTLTVRTNNQERLILDAYELTDKERLEFDYLDWEAIEKGEDSASFIRYRGTTYDLGEFMTTSTLSEFNPLRKWDGYLSDSFFSGIVVRYSKDMDHVTVGMFLA
jgi:hypothetical protein